jgi:VanZ family protein
MGMMKKTSGLRSNKAGGLFIPGIILRLPVIILVIVIWLLSSQSILPSPKGILGFDKVQHFLAYLALSVSAALWVPREWWESRTALRLAAFALTAAAASAYGAIDELHQYFVPGRDCNVWDWLADTLGALAGAAVMVFVLKHGIVRNHKA